MIESYWSLRIYLIQYPLQDSFFHHDHLWRTDLTPHWLPCGLSLCHLPTLWRSLWQISSTISSTDLSIHFSIESAVWSSLDLSFTTGAPLIPTILLLISHIYLLDCVLTRTAIVFGQVKTWQQCCGESGLSYGFSPDKFYWRACGWSLCEFLVLFVVMTELKWRTMILFGKVFFQQGSEVLGAGQVWLEAFVITAK